MSQVSDYISLQRDMTSKQTWEDNRAYQLQKESILWKSLDYAYSKAKYAPIIFTNYK